MQRTSEDYGSYLLADGKVACKLCRLYHNAGYRASNGQCPFCKKIVSILKEMEINNRIPKIQENRKTGAKYLAKRITELT